MTWVGSAGFTRRPLVVAEDHLHHVTELLSALAEAEPSILSRMTVLCLDRTGPDTTRLVDQWLEAYPTLQVAASLGPGSGGARDARRAGLAAASSRAPTVSARPWRGCSAPAGWCSRTSSSPPWPSSRRTVGGSPSILPARSGGCSRRTRRPAASFPTSAATRLPSAAT